MTRANGSSSCWARFASAAGWQCSRGVSGRTPTTLDVVTSSLGLALASQPVTVAHLPKDADKLQCLLILIEHPFPTGHAVVDVVDPTVLEDPRCSRHGGNLPRMLECVNLAPCTDSTSSRGLEPPQFSWKASNSGETFAISKSDLFMKDPDGHDADRIEFGSTLEVDQHRGRPFDYQIANPPYGKDWKRDKAAVEAEARRDDAGRFGAGTPRISDGQLLFLQHMLSHMQRPEEGGGRVVIIMSGSPLFTGDAGSGESEIRRWILENDWLEALIAPPEQMFYRVNLAPISCSAVGAISAAKGQVRHAFTEGATRFARNFALMRPRPTKSTTPATKTTTLVVRSTHIFAFTFPKSEIHESTGRSPRTCHSATNKPMIRIIDNRISASRITISSASV